MVRYGQLLGAWSSGHPEIQAATIDVASPRDPSTEPLPARWTRTDEWYAWYQNPRPQVHVLLTIDESTLTGEASPAEKQAAPSDEPAGAVHPSCAYMGTVVRSGHGVCLVASGPHESPELAPHFGHRQRQ